MSNDITLEVNNETPLAEFDDYARRGVLRVARAVSVAVNDEPTATNALAVALRQVHQEWHDPVAQTDPDERVFGYAIAQIVSDRAEAAAARPAGSEPVAINPLLGPACAVAYFGLNWPAETISTILQLSPEAVEAHLEHARTSGLAHEAATPRSTGIDIRTQIHNRLDEAEPVLPNPKRIAARNKWVSLRGNLRTTAIVAALLLAGVALFSQLVARPDRLADEASEANAVVTPTAAASTSSRDTPVSPATANEAAGEIGTEPRPDLVPTPELIATDGEGGFVGVRSASAQSPRVTFTRSPDGETWSLASQWNLGPATKVTRFERSGEYYLTWIDGVRTSSAAVIGTVGISRDLIAWTVVELALDDEPANGLIYEAVINDVSVSGDNILALVTTTVEIDFGALSLSEGYTCGQTVTDDEVSVKLCNDSELDVLSLSDIATLPQRNRLFVSRDARPFEQIDVPFGNETAAHLTSVNGSFAVTDETGLRFATSRDAVTWQTVTAGKPPFPVRAAATDEANQVVGVGELDGGRAVLFFNDGQTANTILTDIDDLVGDVSPEARAVVAAGPAMWVVYLYEPQTRAWLLTSPDGENWRTIATSPPVGDSPLLLVGDNEALVQWVDSDDATITLGVPLSQ